MCDNEREIVVGLSVEKGVISVINPDGDIRMFRHPLVAYMTPDEVYERISRNELDSNIFDFDAFPENWEIETEVPDITGDLSKTLDSK